MDRYELKPCPFCGGEAKMETYVSTSSSYARCVCKGCNIATQNYRDAEHDGSYFLEHVRHGTGGYRMENKSTNTGIGFTGALQIAFIVLKMVGVISWSWIWVLSPIWITGIVIIIAVIVLIICEKK